MSFKQKIHNQCVQLLNEKINFLQQNLKDLTNSAGNETKSTAGDKHETALAMLQIEQENTSRQLKELLLQKLVLDKINPAIKPVAVTPGSLLKTNKGFFYVSIALGKILVDDVSVIALSAKAPLAVEFMHAVPNENFEINGNIYVIEAIE
jgi:hypothetical protein